ncbi:MAG: DUF86 domain-containing protein [Promethearchaeota archaeon]|nr:MAG: DUF86 domain-containing protein [Candidatus Lokiarchaeota archaeon]
MFIDLAKIDIIDDELKEKLIKMTKFRNLIGHLYMEINNEIIYDILQENLSDFNLFKKQIFSKFKDQLSNQNKK